MSRIGRMPIGLPSGAKVSVQTGTVSVEGPKGKLSYVLPPSISARVDNQKVLVERSNEAASSALHGLARALIANMVQGVVNGFSKELEISGVGYRAQLQGKDLTLQVGFSHPVVLPIPTGLTVEVPKPTIVIVKGPDKHRVGQFAANIRAVAPPEPYKGKGIKYAGEIIRRKAGKAATGAKAGS